MEKLVSVIIPIFNTDKYLDKCIKSILESTEPDFELLLIDDGSTDRSASICKKYCNIDPRISYYYQDNAGVSVARNYGIKKAQGQWLVFVDSDDEIMAEYFSLIRRYANTDIDMLIFDTCWYGKNNKESNVTVRLGNKDKINMVTRAVLSMSLLDGRNISMRSPVAKVYRKEFILDHQIQFPEGIAIGEDELFNIQVYSVLTQGCYYPQMVYNANFRENSTMHRFHNDYYDQTCRFYKELKKILEKEKLYESLSTVYFNSALSGIVAILKNYIFHKENKMSDKDKRKKFFSLKEESIFQEALAHNWKVGSLQRKILLSFVRCNQYTIVKTFFSFYRKRY